MDTDAGGVLPSHSLTNLVTVTSGTTVSYTYNFINDAAYTIASVGTY
jgi:hypothetical protein